MLDDNRFRSTVEVRGTFTDVRGACIVKRGKLAAAPTLPGGASDLERLTQAPIFFPAVLLRLIDESRVVQEADHLSEANPQTTYLQKQDHPNTLRDVCVSKFRGGRGAAIGTFRKLDTADAYRRIEACCWDFTLVHRRLPESVDELMRSYASLYGEDADMGLAQRRRRAADVLERRQRTFRRDLAQDGGYDMYRDLLLQSVRKHCQDRTSRYRATITDEDLAVALYVVQRNSFAIADRPLWQWTCGYEAFAGMFKSLKADGVIRRGGCNRNKIIAMKQILERAGLIECADPRYLPFGKMRGVSKKYTIGPKHWRYVAFRDYRKTIEVKIIRPRSYEVRLAAA